eukprot:SAG31_NODE_3449_length_4257_cov_2.277297_3_plen_123_part_00
MQLEIADSEVSDLDLQRLFTAVDADGSGSIDGAEFSSWLTQQLAAVSAAGLSFFDQVVAAFVRASAARVHKLGWRHLFTQYDTDGSGELDPEEFLQAVRIQSVALDAPSVDAVCTLFRRMPG